MVLDKYLIWKNIPVKFSACSMGCVKKRMKGCLDCQRGNGGGLYTDYDKSFTIVAKNYYMVTRNSRRGDIARTFFALLPDSFQMFAHRVPILRWIL
jgi:hypothetical protein